MPTSPEYERKPLPKEVAETLDRFDPEVEKRLQELGAQVRPQAPQGVQDDQGATLAQPIPAPAGSSPLPTIQIPVDQTQASAMSGGDVTDSNTWLGILILRKIKIALAKGWQIIVGQK
jgi:hypothetical protein